MDTNRYTSGTYTWFQAGYRDEDAKAMRFLDRSVGNSWEITWKKEPRNLVVVGCPWVRVSCMVRLEASPHSLQSKR